MSMDEEVEGAYGKFKDSKLEEQRRKEESERKGKEHTRRQKEHSRNSNFQNKGAYD